MPKLGERVKESSTTTGTGNFTLTGVVTGFQSFSAVLSVGDTTFYTISNDTSGEYEVGQGTYSSANTLTRDQIFASSNSNALVNFGSGSKIVFITYPAKTAVTSGQAVAFSIALGG